MIKFQRNYLFYADGIRFKEPVQIRLPFTIEFDIIRNSYTSTNECKIRLYNLSPAHRALLTHDQWDFADPQTALSIVLYAGYGAGPNWPVIFKGTSTRAYSQREGVDFITTIECFDGGLAYQNGQIGLQLAAGQNMGDIYAQLIKRLEPYGIAAGAISQSLQEGKLSKGQTYVGNVMEILRMLTGANIYIDNEILNILLPTEALDGNVTISAKSGLLGTPVKQNNWLFFDILFEPNLVVGSIINLDSSTGITNYNGQHRVFSVTHRGVISGSVCGDAVTSLGVEAGVFKIVAGKFVGVA